ncbi:hypothetical protein DVQ53_22570, partial [Yersinia enterocolitica]|nr:hypothetical protein [Yersinia enterocolitica]
SVGRKGKTQHGGQQQRGGTFHGFGLLVFFRRCETALISVAVGACEQRAASVPCKRVETDHVPVKI